jgi:hypothetical protein
LQKCKKPKSHRKATEKNTEKPQTFDFQGLDEFLFSFLVTQKCIEKIVFLTAKIVPTDGRVGGLGGWVFSVKPKNRKEIHQVLDFQQFAVFGGFSVAFR